MRQLRVVVGDDHAVSSQQNRSQPEPKCLDVVGAELDVNGSRPSDGTSRSIRCANRRDRRGSATGERYHLDLVTALAKLENHAPKHVTDAGA